MNQARHAALPRTLVLASRRWRWCWPARAAAHRSRRRARDARRLQGGRRARFANVGPADAQPARQPGGRSSRPGARRPRPRADRQQHRRSAGRGRACSCRRARCCCRPTPSRLPASRRAAPAPRAPTDPAGLRRRAGQAADARHAPARTSSWEPDFFGACGARHATPPRSTHGRARPRCRARAWRRAVRRRAGLLRAARARRRARRSCARPSRPTPTRCDLTERRYRPATSPSSTSRACRPRSPRPRSQALALDRDRALHEHALAVLLGEVPSGFSLRRSDWSARCPACPPALPAAVLARRPDVAAAQLRCRPPQARAGVARPRGSPTSRSPPAAATRRPQLSATCSSGRRARGASARCCRCRSSTAAAARPACRPRTAGWDTASRSYREQVLVAFRDVEDQLASLRLLADQAGAQKARGRRGDARDGAVRRAATATAS